jgi:hypothetical protein
METSQYLVLLLETAIRFAAMLVVLGFVAYLLRPRITRSHVATLFRYTLMTLIYAAVASVSLVAFMSKWGFNGESPSKGFTALIEHSAQRPFVYRVLSPEIIKYVSKQVTDPVTRGDEEWFLDETPLRRYTRKFERWNLEKSVAWHVTYLYLFGCLFAAIFAARFLAASVYPRANPLFLDYAPAVAGLLLPLTFVRGGYLYDFPELMFLFLCVLALARGRWLAFYPLFVLACFNKESNVLLVAYFVAVAAPRMPRRRWMTHAGVQLAIGGAIVVGLRLAFRDNSGDPAWFLLPLNVLYLITPKTYFGFFETYAPLIPFPVGFSLISLFLVGVAALWRWSDKPLEVRRMLLLSSAVLAPLYLAFGFLDEIRALSILFPALFLAGFHSVDELYRTFAGAPG